MLRRFSIAALAGLLLVAACGDDGTASPPVTAVQYEVFRAKPTACGAVAPDQAVEMTFAGPDDLALPDDVGATLHTSCGAISIELYPELAPATVNSFAFLAEQGYFDGTVAHRIVEGFVVQMGDPTATGRGNPVYRIPDELPASDYRYSKWVVAMANGGPNTGGSQFFIVLDDIDLDPDYTVFGVVISGFAALEAIAAIPVGINPDTLERSVPLEALYIESVSIER